MGVAFSGEEIIGLVNAVYREVFRGVRSVEREDVVSAGVLGILEAEKKYDVNKGAFSTYAWRCAKNAMVRFVRRELAISSGSRVDVDLVEVEGGLDSYVDEKYKEMVDGNRRYALKVICKVADGESDSRKYICKDFLMGCENQDIAKKFKCSIRYVNKCIYDFKNKIQRDYYFTGDGEFRCNR